MTSQEMKQLRNAIADYMNSKVICIKYEDGGMKVLKEGGFETIAWLINHVRLAGVSSIAFGEIDKGKILWEKQFVACDIFRDKAEIGE